ncbi:MAG: MoxR-like ATPase, partial [Gaiellales bacterium]|nr:MoxR-like ATPase [Gaiellales bacterium]
PFFCIGTMNPHDNSGTFEMAHASCDRFAMRTGIGYPSESGERDLLNRFSNADLRMESDPIVAPGDVVQLQKVIAQLPAGEPVRAYLVRLLRSTRDHPDVLVGASPRALLSMYRCTQAAALLDNAAEVAVKHVRSLFEPCIAHRIRVRPEASARAVCEEILEGTPVPVTTPPPTISAAPGRAHPGDTVQIAA